MEWYQGAEFRKRERGSLQTTAVFLLMRLELERQKWKETERRLVKPISPTENYTNFYCHFGQVIISRMDSVVECWIRAVPRFGFGTDRKKLDKRIVLSPSVERRICIWRHFIRRSLHILIGTPRSIHRITYLWIPYPQFAYPQMWRHKC